MASDHTIHFRGAPKILRAAIDVRADPALVWHIAVAPSTKPGRAILHGEGFADDFTASKRLNKCRLTEALQHLRALWDRRGRDKVLVLSQTETEFLD